jgi:hypothetical protein
MDRPPSAQFQISVDGKPRFYRHHKDLAMQAAEYLKSKNPHSEVVVLDTVSGEKTVVEYKER